MAARISDNVRDQVIKEISAGKRRAEVARRNKISETSVKKILRAAGILQLPMKAGRAAKTHAATEATMLYARQRRADLSLACLEEAHRTLLQLGRPMMAYDFGGRDHSFVSHQLPEPDARSRRDLAIALGILIDKSIQLERANAEVNEAPRAAIIALFDAMQAEESKATQITIEEN
jgi:hypothetical protein